MFVTTIIRKNGRTTRVSVVGLHSTFESAKRDYIKFAGLDDNALSAWLKGEDCVLGHDMGLISVSVKITSIEADAPCRHL